jgi:hypothetical protein
MRRRLLIFIPTTPKQEKNLSTLMEEEIYKATGEGGVATRIS